MQYLRDWWNGKGDEEKSTFGNNFQFFRLRDVNTRMHELSSTEDNKTWDHVTCANTQDPISLCSVKGTDADSDGENSGGVARRWFFPVLGRFGAGFLRVSSLSASIQRRKAVALPRSQKWT